MTKRYIIILLAIVILALMVWVVIVVVPQGFYPSFTADELNILGLQGKERVDAVNGRWVIQSGARTGIIQGVVGIGVLLGAIVGWFQLRQTSDAGRLERELSRQRQVIDRFASAIVLLDDNKSANVKLGGIFSLLQVAESAEAERATVAEVLSAYVRTHAHVDVASRNGMPPLRTRRANLRELRVYAPDVQAAMTALGKHTAPWFGFEDKEGLRFRYTDLRRVNLQRGYFQRAKFTEAHLERAWLRSAHFDGASFRDSNLRGADLADASLAGANLRGTDLREVSGLKDVNLERAFFDKTTRWPITFPATRAIRAGAERVSAKLPPMAARSVVVEVI